MPDTWFDVLYYASLAANLGAAVLAWRGVGPWRAAGWLAFALCALQALVMGLHLGRPPLSGAWEAFAMQALCLDALALWPCGHPEADRSLRAWAWAAAGLFLAIFLALERKLYPDWFNYEYHWARLFFILRNASLSFFVFSALAALAGLRRGLAPAGKSLLLIWSRNFLLLGTAVFLAGEFCGFTWRLQWLGDYWSWSRNFLEATLVFLLVTAALHLPPRWAARPGVRTFALAAPGVITAGLTLIHLGVGN